MPIKYENDTVYLSGVVGVEDAEDLYKVFIEQNVQKIDAILCEHMHAAVLQIILGFKVQIVSFPQNSILTQWLQQSLSISN